MTHTPGPWNYRIIPDDGSRANQHLYWVDHDHGSPIADVFNTGKTAKANARLIAAAPDLLTVLQKIVNNWGNLHPKDRQQACIAIAKAKGG